MVPAAALRKGMQERGASRLKEADYTIAASALDRAAPSRKCFFVRRESDIQAKQSSRDRRSSAGAVKAKESAAYAPGLQPDVKQRGRHSRRERKQRLARWEDAQQAQGHTGCQVNEESSADCPVCWGNCTHSNGKCPCLEHLPEELLAEVLDLCGRYQRNYALTLIQRCWERSKKKPPEVPTVAHVRGSLYCYSCDSQDHSAQSCPELLGVDGASKSCLMTAYRLGTCNGKTPGQIFRDWEDGAESKLLPPCPVCKSRAHCFEGCARKGHLRQEDFTLIVAALRAGQPQSARGVWEAVQARKEQGAGRRDTFPKRRATRAVPVKLSPAPASDAHVIPPGGNYARVSQAVMGVPAGAIPDQQQQQLTEKAPRSSTPFSTQGSWSTANSSAASLSLWAPTGLTKPYWHEDLAARAPTQGDLSVWSGADSGCPLGGASSSAVPAAGESGAAQRARYSVSRQLVPPGYSEERVRHQHKELQEIPGWVPAAQPHAAASAGPAAARLLAAAGLGVSPGGRPGSLQQPGAQP
ncbi:g7332 [Coccomyxa viridis]|uniref:G7332 protein n=1 Tax=Coccomyxa viridis TaxID=1274662 RepID=A0ABP1G005_9CHLO